MRPATAAARSVNPIGRGADNDTVVAGADGVSETGESADTAGRTVGIGLTETLFISTVMVLPVSSYIVNVL